jgi:alcohol oxidase
MLWKLVSCSSPQDCNGQLQANICATEGKVRPTEEEVDKLGPEFRKAWDADFKNAPDRPIMIMALYNCYYGDHSTLPDGAEYVSLANWTA